MNYLQLFIEHSVALPAGLFDHGFGEGVVRTQNFIVESGQVNYVPVEAAFVRFVLGKVLKQEAFLLCGLFRFLFGLFLIIVDLF